MMLDLARPETATQAWIRSQMPCLLSVNVATGSDRWLRDRIHGADSGERPSVQRVIVQGTDERDRIITAWAALKSRRGLPYGGAISQRWLSGGGW